MNRTRIIFIAIIGRRRSDCGGVASLLTQRRRNTPDVGLTVDSPDAVKIRILTALARRAWVRSAADDFNAGDNSVDGVPIEVEVVAIDGLTALGRWDRNEFGALAGRCPPRRS